MVTYSYCTPTDVLAIVDTDMSPAEVDVLIDVISAAMVAVVSSGLDTLLLRGICQLWTAYRVMLKDPNARTIGGAYSEDRGVSLKLMKDELDFMLNIGTGGISFTAASESLG